MTQTSDDVVVDVANQDLILIEEDGIKRGGVEFPEIRDLDCSVTLIMLPGTTHTTGLHWHEQKTEYLQVLQGRARVTVGDRTAVFGPDDGTITVPRFTLHEFGRADKDAQGADYKETELRIREWTSPADRKKEAFFRNLLGAIQSWEGGVLGTIKLVLSMAAVMREHDNYPVIVKGPSFVRRHVTYAVLGFVGGIARMSGFRGTDAKYTPREVMDELYS